MEFNKEGLPLLPSAMSPTEYTYIVLGRPPNKTSIISYLNSGKIPCVAMTIEYREETSQTLHKVRHQNWVKVPESERVINRRYLINIRAIKSNVTREPWEYLLKLNPEELPKCPKLEKRKSLEKLVVKIRVRVFTLFLNQDNITKPDLVLLFFSSYEEAKKEGITKLDLSKIVDWMLRKKYVERDTKNTPKDKRQTLLTLTELGIAYADDILKLISK